MNKQILLNFLAMLMAILFITGNIIYQKFVVITLPFSYQVSLSAGALIYPFTMIISDLITIIYGKSMARIIVIMAIGMNLIVALIMLLATHFDAAPWSVIQNEDFSKVFSLFYLNLFASMLAATISQFIDIQIFAKLSILGNKSWKLSMRAAIAGALALAIDSFVILSILFLGKIIPADQFLNIFISSASYKIVIVLLISPLMFVCYQTLNKYR